MRNRIVDVQKTEIEEISLGDVVSPERLKEVYENENEFYWTSDWSPELYVELARAGFMSVAFELGGTLELLVPQLQQSYAVLDWENLHASKSMLRWMRSPACKDQNYRLAVGHDLESVYLALDAYHGQENWMGIQYFELLSELSDTEPPGFTLTPVALLDSDENVVAGEIGYRCGDIYTSLTGFSDRNRRNCGKLQLLLLGEHLRDTGYAFWNLGHPFMQYKLDLGAQVLPRAEFLKRWHEHR